MITDFARHIARYGRFLVAVAATLFGFAMSPPLQAKDDNYRVCTANANGDGWDCVEGRPAAGQAPPKPAPVPTPAADLPAGRFTM